MMNFFVLQVFKCAILWAEELVLEWVPCLSQKFGRSILTEWCSHSLCFLHQRFQIQWLSHTMLHFLFISLLRMQMSVWFWIMRLYMISASGLSSWLLLAVSKHQKALDVMYYMNFCLSKWKFNWLAKCKQFYLTKLRRVRNILISIQMKFMILDFGSNM